MPRRPRPAHRQPGNSSQKAKGLKPLGPPSKPKKSPTVAASEGSFERDDGSSHEFEEGSSQDSISGSDSENEPQHADEEGDDSDVDAPRVALWEEDEEDFLKESEEEAEGSTHEEHLESDLKELPLGVLRRAQTLLKRAESESSSESSDDDAPDEEDIWDTKGKGRQRVEWSTKVPTDLAKRSNKHAPIEMSAKRPVSRNRIVVDVPKIVARDPRFLPTTGAYEPKQFQQSYGFLAQNRKSELQTLREALKKARKMLSSSPRDLRAEREQEVERLDRAVKRAESTVNRDRMNQVESDALTRVKKEEREKQNQGKKEWFLKKTDKQKLLTEARFEALAKDGGQGAVKRAIAKKQKKTSQKEKRSRPYAKGESGIGEKRRPSSIPSEDRPRKKMRL